MSAALDSASAQADGAEPVLPAPEFAVIGVEEIQQSAAPAISFLVRASEPEGHEIHTAALTAQIHIDPARRTYDASTRERLVELFGDPERWGATAQSFWWCRVDALVPRFRGETVFKLTVPCTYDLELAATRYFYSMPDGEVPLSFHFTGTVLYRGPLDRLQVIAVPWSCSDSYRLPVETWRRTMERHYPNGTFVRVGHDTLEALQRYRAEAGLATFDGCVQQLLEKG